MNTNDTITISIDKERNQYHKEKRKKKIIRFLVVFCVWMIIFAYLITPLSSSKMIHIKGNVYLKKDEILELANIKRTWWWIIDKKQLKNKLESYEIIDSVNIDSSYKGLTITLIENYPLAIKDNKYVMNVNWNTWEKEKYPYQINNLIDITLLEDEYYSMFLYQYSQINLSIREVFYKAMMKDDKIVILYGRFSENTYFKMYLNLEYLSLKLNNEKFANIKGEILGKVNEDKIKYDMENPCIVKYDFTNVYEYKIG